MSSEQLWETTMNPATRKLLKVTIEDAQAADEAMRHPTGCTATERTIYSRRDRSTDAQRSGRPVATGERCDKPDEIGRHPAPAAREIRARVRLHHCAEAVVNVVMLRGGSRRLPDVTPTGFNVSPETSDVRYICHWRDCPSEKLRLKGCNWLL